MKLISIDFSNLDKKTIYDFGDDEAIDELFKYMGSSRDKITREFFDDAERGVRFKWMLGLSEILLNVDSNTKKFLKAVKREVAKLNKYKVNMMNKYRIIVD